MSTLSLVQVFRFQEDTSLFVTCCWHLWTHDAMDHSWSEHGSKQTLFCSNVVPKSCSSRQRLLISASSICDQSKAHSATPSVNTQTPQRLVVPSWFRRSSAHWPARWTVNSLPVLKSLQQVFQDRCSQFAVLHSCRCVSSASGVSQHVFKQPRNDRLVPNPATILGASLGRSQNSSTNMFG